MSPSGHREALSRLNLEMIAKSAVTVARCCTAMRLDCRDPPSATSRILYWLGYNQHQVRSFWEKMESIGTLSLEIYRYHSTTFRLEARYDPGPLREAPVPWEGLECPLDDLDAERVEHRFAPRAHRLYLYIAGGLGGSGLHVNAIRVLSLMERSRPGILEDLELLTIDLIWGRLGPGEAAERIAGLIAPWARILEAIIPKVPLRSTLVERVVPALRRAHGTAG